MRSSFISIAVLACGLACGFPILAADEKPVAAQSPSEESSSNSSEKPDVTPDAEGFYGIPNGVIDDPDGYVNLRKEKSADSPVIAKVKRNEPFEFDCGQNNTWCKVKLASGVTGWMHYSRIKRYYTEKDLPKGPEDSGEEIDEQARKQGVNYYEVTRAAAHGDKKALRTFFTVGLDGAALETH
ncbi:MAG: SH3 domain-containing protein, partial [Verrucomicrobia bacterium]|nr:SH3 domain-containing protein [Verrucomicrobiota bacterium]